MNYSETASKEKYNLKTIKKKVKNYSFEPLTKIFGNEKQLRNELIDFIYEYREVHDFDVNKVKTEDIRKDYQEKLKTILLKYKKSDKENNVENYLNSASEVRRLKNLDNVIILVLILDIIGLLIMLYSLIKLIYNAKFQ